MSTLWRLTVKADFKTLGDAAELLDECYPPIALSWSLFDEDEAAKLDVLFEHQPDETLFRKRNRAPAR
jgi:hypothetical protein